MNKFELFCMIFYALDSVWEDNPEEALGEYLSGANPFMFEDLGSAIPEVYDTFCKVIVSEVDVSESYDKACSYIDYLNNFAVSDAFARISKEEWNESLEEYLSSEHKGMES